MVQENAGVYITLLFKGNNIIIKLISHPAHPMATTTLNVVICNGKRSNISNLFCGQISSSDNHLIPDWGTNDDFMNNYGTGVEQGVKGTNINSP